MDIQVPLLAAKALLLLLLFAFVYAVVRRGVGDLKKVSEEDLRSPGSARSVAARRNGGNGGSGGNGGYGGNGRAPSNGPETRLVVEKSEVLEPRTRFHIKGGITVIGRSPGSDIVLKSDDFASSSHARLTRHAGLLYVEDAYSTNGTYVNDEKIVGATPLHQGDEITVGSTTFRYAE
ncbi:FHA domain-containing protein [Rubrobacter aplysinae]|uniref:FHA domain-containing protein n=1 Tax=Rubrobacter aplysinae TaxID=909625 RepID=UPI00069DA3A4|nr:FHA domain-containing protein [Rubrobacter aplysinae]